jgi:hypothetical protein
MHRAPSSARVSAAQYQPYAASRTTSGDSPARAITTRRYSGSFEIRTSPTARRSRSAAPAPSGAGADPSRRSVCPRMLRSQGPPQIDGVSTPSMSREPGGAEAPPLILQRPDSADVADRRRAGGGHSGFTGSPTNLIAYALLPCPPACQVVYPVEVDEGGRTSPRRRSAHHGLRLWASAMAAYPGEVGPA